MMLHAILFAYELQFPLGFRSRYKTKFVAYDSFRWRSGYKIHFYARDMFFSLCLIDLNVIVKGLTYY